jgi:hypothetical protein
MIRTLRALGYLVIALICQVCHSGSVGPRAAADRQAQEQSIASSVLVDLASMRPMNENDVPRDVYCIGLGGALGLSAPDPDPSLLGSVRAQLPSAVRMSECELRNTVARKGSSQYAVAVGVSRIDWKSPEFVHVLAWRFVSPVAAEEWNYTVSLSNGRWAVDAARRTLGS